MAHQSASSAMKYTKMSLRPCSLVHFRSLTVGPLKLQVDLQVSLRTLLGASRLRRDTISEVMKLCVLLSDASKSARGKKRRSASSDGYRGELGRESSDCAWFDIFANKNLTRAIVKNTNRKRD